MVALKEIYVFQMIYLETQSITYRPFYDLKTKNLISLTFEDFTINN